MITARSKGFQLLDSNIEVFRAGIERILDRTKGPEWKSSFAKRKGEYYKKFVETKEIDYNLIPALVSDYPNSFDNGAWLKQDVLLDLVSSVRDLRNLIAHHAEFNEHSLRVLTESLRGAFKMLNLGSRFQELDNQRIPNPTTYTKGAAMPRKYTYPTDGLSSDIEGNAGPDDNVEPKNWVLHNNFVISESKRGLGQMICVEFQKGANKGRRFLYSHDLVYDICISHLETLDSWKTYGINTSSTSIRSEVREYVKELD